MVQLIYLDKKHGNQFEVAKSELNKMIQAMKIIAEKIGAKFTEDGINSTFEDEYHKATLISK